MYARPGLAGAVSSRIRRPSRNRPSRCGASRKSRADRLGGVGHQSHEQTLGAARDGAREMEVGGRGRSRRQHEGAQRREVRVEPVDVGLQPRDLRLDDAQRFVAQGLAAIGRAEIGAEIEQIVLNPQQHGIEFRQRGIGRCREARDADRAVGFVDRAIGLDARIVLGAALPAAERRRAGIAGLGVNAVQDDHGRASFNTTVP